MKRFILTGLVGFGCLVPLMGCVVEPVRPVVVGPPVVAPVVVGPPVVARPRYYGRRWYRGRPVYHPRRPHWRHR